MKGVTHSHTTNSGNFLFHEHTRPAARISPPCLIYLCASTFQLLDKLWSHVSSLPSPGSCLQPLSRIGFSILVVHRFSWNANASSRARFSRVDSCTRKSPYELIRVRCGGDPNSCDRPMAATTITCYTAGAITANR